MADAASAWNYGIQGVLPEPRAGYRSEQARERSLVAFSEAVWQRHVGGSHRPSPARPWPTGSFRVHWPLLASDLLVADWKIAGAAAADFPLIEETDLELLDPPPVPDSNWREVYGTELSRHPTILEDLERGATMDGVELVLERAGLTAGERAVIRPWLAGDDVRTIAVALHWRPQTVATLLNTGCWRLKNVASWSRPMARPRTLSPKAARASAEVAAAS